jgi:hypothetical protein
MTIKLINLDDTITTLSGAKIMMAENAPMTYRNALVSMCETYRPSDPAKSNTIAVYSAGNKIFNAKDSVVLLETEVEILKEMLTTSGWVAVVVGRLTDYLNNAPIEKGEDKK